MSKSLLRSHQREFRDFWNMALAQLDHATGIYSNDGHLWLDPSDTNLFACKWLAKVPQLPAEIAKLLPFRRRNNVMIDARYRYGGRQALINIWISSPPGKTHKSFALGLMVDPATHAVRQSGMNTMGSDHGRELVTNEANTRQVMNAIFAGNGAYSERANQLDIVDAFRLGIATQADLGAEPYGAEEAVKSFQARNVGNGFQLKVRIVDRAHPQGKPSRLFVTLQRVFAHDDYTPPGIYGGFIEHQLTLVTAPNGAVIDASRDSKVRLSNEPAITEMSVGQAGRPTPPMQPTMVIMMNEVGGSALPAGLRAKLYPDNAPTLADLAFFRHLIVEPIRDEDVRI